MKIVHALWEKRNLDADSYKMTVTDEDTWETVVNEEKDVYGDYLVMKVPSHRRDISTRMHELGYAFIEAQYYCYYDNKKEFILNPIQKRLMDSITCEPMNEAELEEMYGRIAEGLFIDDTVAVDPYFSVELANRRFNGLIADEISRGAVMYKLTYKDKIVGFFGLTDFSEKDVFAFIGGIYPEYQRIGLGTFMNCFEIMEARKRGIVRTHSAFSSNNHGANAVHMAMGYILDRVDYIFVKHNKYPEGDLKNGNK